MSAVRRKPAVGLRMLERRSRVVELASQAMSYRAIAETVGCAVSTVQADLAEHWAETRPSSEVTETLRLMQDDEYLHLRRRCYALLEAADEVPVQLQVLDRINKISEHRRRLWGMDLQSDGGLTVNVLTREWLAEQLADEPEVVEVEAEEVTDGDH